MDYPKTSIRQFKRTFYDAAGNIKIHPDVRRMKRYLNISNSGAKKMHATGNTAIKTIRFPASMATKIVRRYYADYRKMYPMLDLI